MPVIRAVFRHAATEKTGNKTTANYMNENYPRPDGRCWTAPTIGHVIANRVYLGEISYRPRKEDFEPLINTEAHEPIIDEAMWLAAQRTPGIKRTNAGPALLLSGLIRCAGCRYRMSASRGGANIRAYRCIGHHGAGKCPAPAVVKSERIEQFVLREVQDQWEPRFAVTLQGAGTVVTQTDLRRGWRKNDLSGRHLRMTSRRDGS